MTYSKAHKYKISSHFNTDMPELVANQLQWENQPKAETTTEHATETATENATEISTTTVTETEPIRTIAAATQTQDGRDFQGQVVKNLGGIDYILIGNQEQLRAIGSNQLVYTAVYQASQATLVSPWEVDLDATGNPIMLYSGDADLELEQNNHKGFTFQQLDSAGKNGLRITGRCGVNQSTGQIDPNMDIEDSAHKYSISEHYIVFRDIDLGSTQWTPLTFSGTLIGAKALEEEALWNNETITATGTPVISNVNVNQTQPMDVSKYLGVGFFATITNEINVADVGVSAGTVRVSNLELQNVSINNNVNTAQSTTTILSALTSSLGWLVGGLVDVLVVAVTIGQVKLNLRDTLSALLNARAQDPTIYATGAFAGRVVGDVAVTGCKATGPVQVSSINDHTGGFVGYSEGVTQYSGLSKTLGIGSNVLSSLLNAIPGLGLGDLIIILLDNALPVGQLIPTGYINPKIQNSKVVALTATLGSTQKSFQGGFCGQQVGTMIDHCSLENSTVSIQAKEYGGGFSGISRDADIKGTLSSVGIELLRVMQPQSLLLNCSIANSKITVEGQNYLGGFTGAQSNSYAINCNATGSCSILGTGSYAGGFTGIATVGWVTNLGKGEVKNASLLSTAGGLLTELLSSNPQQAGMLLSLTGIAPSAILGCQLNFETFNVKTEGSYAGGLLGGGDGVYLTESSATYLEQLSYWKYGALDKATINQRDNELKGLTQVSVGGNRAGGLVGSATTANITGLLNNTLGLGAFLGFTIGHSLVEGVAEGFEVTATGNYAGGALGEAVGGTIEGVHVSQIKSVSANNRVGGFVGAAGPGDLAGVNGLSLNLLGLNHLLTAKNLLSVGEGISTTITDALVSGTDAGLTVLATGKNGPGEVAKYMAGGFIGISNSTDFLRCYVRNLQEVRADENHGFAGGFVASSATRGLAEVSDETNIKTLVEAGNLLSAVAYLIPSYEETSVTFIAGGRVLGNTAGGFAGEFQSGTVTNQAQGAGNYFSVYNLAEVKGGAYGGGFGGKVYSGGLTSSTGGISILGGINGLNIQAADLLSLINAYIPRISHAGVKSQDGFTVSAEKSQELDSKAGSAGGFIGYGIGIQVSYCDVLTLKHTKVTPPQELEAVNAPSYFNQQSTYAVTGETYAGGYIGYMDIASASSIGKGLSVLGNVIKLS